MIFEKAIIKTIYYLCRDRETSSIMAFAIYLIRKEKIIVVDATSTSKQDVNEASSQETQLDKRTLIAKIKKIRMFYEFEKTIARSMIF